MILGLYKHSKGNWYIAYGWVWESTNDQPRERKVLYFSLGKLQRNARRAEEFLDGRFRRVFPPWPPG